MAESLTKYIPRYRFIANDLRQQIRTGAYHPGDMIPTESKLVQKYEVSRGTVRDALDVLARERLVERHRGKGTFVRVASKSTQKGTVVFSYACAYSLSHPYLQKLYHSFEEAVQEYARDQSSALSVQCIRLAQTPDGGGYTLLHTEDHFQAQVLDSEHVEGICLTTSVTDQEALTLKRRGIKCIELDGAEESLLPTIYYDRLATKKLAVTHLSNLGHRKIGLVLTCDYGESGERSVDRAVAWGRRQGLQLGDPYNVYCSDWSRELACQAAKELLMQPDRPTALVCMGDFLALGVRDAAVELGLAVPKDLSVVGFGDYVPDAGLTTIQFPFREMARKGARVLLEMITNGAYDGPGQVRLEGSRLIVRDSTAPPPSNK